MTALAADRTDLANKGAYLREPGVAAAKKIFMGAIVVADAAGYARPGYVATGLRALGCAREAVDNSAGADGALTVPVEAGIYPLANSAAGDLITIADIGDDVYIVDDQTVAKTDGGATRSVCGQLFDIDENGTLWVKVGL